jgi:hypothetical protein
MVTGMGHTPAGVHPRQPQPPPRRPASKRHIAARRLPGVEPDPLTRKGTTMRTTTRTTTRLIGVAVATLALAAPAGFAQAHTSAPYCGIRWGSLDKTGGAFDIYPKLTNVRAGRHACFDRLVIDLSAPREYFHVGYVTQVGGGPEQGPVVPLRGGAKLAIWSQISVWDANGRPTYRPANPAELVNVTGWPTFRQVALGATVESGTTIGLGVRARLPYRVFTLNGPGNGSRLIIDVAHHW